MPIVPSNLDYYYSGGASNTDAEASLGGAKSTVAGGIIVSGQSNNDMDDITGQESEDGIEIYRAFFLQNNHATLTFQTPKLYIESQTSSSTTEVSVGVAPEAKNTAIELLSDEESIPTVTFMQPANAAAGLSLVDLDSGDYVGWWIKYNVTAGTAAISDSYTTTVQGDTGP